MADVHHRVAGFAERLEQFYRVVGSGIGADQRPFTLGEVVILDIDYDECLLGHGCFLERLDVARSIGFGRRFEDWPHRQ
ncbi:hypothetical protein D3C76_1755780 [compost metagenome]